MSRIQRHYDLLDAFGEEGCPVCRLTLAEVARHIGAINYESVGDPEVRAGMVASRGFCNLHAHQWLRETHVLGTAMVYADVLDRTVAELRGAAPRPAGRLGRVAARLRSGSDGAGGGAVLGDAAPCPVCAVRDAFEEATVGTLLAGLADPAFAAGYAAAAGLCLPHLRRALAVATDEGTDEETVRALWDGARAAEERLLAHLAELIRRHDYRSRGGPAGEERDAAERAVRHVAGEPGIGG